MGDRGPTLVKREPPMMRLLLFGIRGMICLASGVAVLAGYSIASRLAIAEPMLLPLTPIDRAIPLLPWTIWLYHLLGIGMVIGWFLVPNAWLGRRLLLGVMLCTAVSMLAFVYFPTGRYPTVLPAVDTVSLRALELLWEVDDPSNCLPSLHVSLATCVALTTREYGRSRFARALPVCWAIAISASTLTTKQHYLVDVIAGAAVGWGAYALVKWAARRDRLPFWSVGGAPIRLPNAREQAHLDRLQTLIDKGAWSLDELPHLQADQRAPLPPEMVRFLNQVIYVEYLAAINFEFLARATTDDPKLRRMYEQFALEERQHAEGLRRLLHENGVEIQAPGLGCALLLHWFDTLDPSSDADAILVALSIPVFETFLDAGTIPFLKNHPAIASPGLEQLIGNICRDESRHLAVNWAVSRAAVRSVPKRRFARLRMLCNPKILRGAIATPFLAMDVYAHARRVGFDFRKLMPSFRRLFHLHRGYPELAAFPMWIGIRVWVVCASLVTLVVIAIDRIAPRLLAWLAKVVPWMTDRICQWLFDDALLERRGLPRAGERTTTAGESCRGVARKYGPAA